MSLGTDQMEGVAKNLKDQPLRIVVENISSDCDKRLVSQNPLKFQIHIKIKGILTESSAQLDLGQASVIHALEKQMSKESEEQIQALLKRLTALNSDPIGFGEVYRSQVYHSNLTADSWHEMYKNASYDVKVDMRIVRLGQIQ
ncbi:hypothetical protein D3C85_1305310 [compost metagenome]